MAQQAQSTVISKLHILNLDLLQIPKSSNTSDNQTSEKSRISYTTFSILYLVAQTGKGR